MSFVADDAQLGLLPVQNHTFRRNGVVDDRHVVYMGRTKERDEAEFVGSHIWDHGTVGDWTGPLHWHTAEESQRPIGMWNAATPCILTEGTPRQVDQFTGTSSRPNRIASSRKAGGRLGAAVLGGQGAGKGGNNANKKKQPRGGVRRKGRGQQPAHNGLLFFGFGPQLPNAGSFNPFGQIHIGGRPAFNPGANFSFGDITIGGKKVFNPNGQFRFGNVDLFGPDLFRQPQRRPELRQDKSAFLAGVGG